MTDHQPATPGRSFGQDRHEQWPNGCPAPGTIVHTQRPPSWHDELERRQRERALRPAGLHALETPLTSSADGNASSIVFYATADELLQALGKPGKVVPVSELVWAKPITDANDAAVLTDAGWQPLDANAATNSTIIHQQRFPQKSCRARVQAGATLGALLLATLVAFILGWVWGAGSAPKALPRSPYTHTQARSQEPDAPAPSELIPS